MKKIITLIVSLFIFGFTINIVEAQTIEARITYAENDFTINIDETTTIGDLKELIKDEKGIDTNLQRLSNVGTNEEYVDNLIISTSPFCLISTPNNYIEIKLEKIINEENIINFNSIPPTTDKEFNYINISLAKQDIYIINNSCNTNYTNCKAEGKDSGIYYNNLVINYIYDSNNKTVIDEILANLPSDKSRYDIKDMEVINYWYKGGDVSYYSSELMNYINYKNFNIDFYAGDNTILNTHMFGVAAFKYDNVAYYMNDNFGYNMSHVLYVPSNTASSDYLTTIKSRIDKIIEDNYTLKDEGTIDTFLDNYIDENYDLDFLYNSYVSSLVEGENPMSKELYKQELIDNLKSENEEEIALSSDNHIYSITINNETKYFVICADSSKMVDIEYKTSDIITDITVSSISTSIYNDALINVNKITNEDEEYSRIINILNVEDGEMFDIKLYSSSKDKYVTTLSDGTFEVKIPIPEKYNNKNLVVYYVDAFNNIEEHTITVTDGYATFTTNHFSVYTLTEKIDNPQTGDNIIINIILLLLSTLSIIFAFIISKKNKYSKEF